MLTLAVLLIPLVAAGSVPVVQTNYGKVSGFTYQTTSHTSADVFYNIPFAQPPVGNLRFEKPLPPQSWKGVRNGTAKGPACYPHVGSVQEPYSSEDCLQLNIIRPSNVKKHSKLPVLIWIHGGGYEVGSAVSYGHEGFANIYTPQDLIVVSVQYRLGPLGFFSTGDSRMPGNLGMWDQLESIRWLYENIEYFGGDKNRLIAWGLSAGGGSVSALTLSPHSRDYIHSSIEHSGSAWAGFHVGTYVAKYSLELGAQLGCTTDIKNCLKNFTIPEMYAAVEATGPTVDFVGCIKYGPVIDGDFMPAHPSVLIQTAPPKPTLISQARKEGNFFTTFGLVTQIHNFKVDMTNQSIFTREHLIERIQTQLVNSAYYSCNTNAALDKVVARYVDAKYQSGFGNDYFIDQYTEFVSDTMFNVAGLEGAHAKRDAGWPVYLYQTNHVNEVMYTSRNIPGGFPERCKGSPHGNDFAYIVDFFAYFYPAEFDTHSPTEYPITFTEQANIISFAHMDRPLFPDVGRNPSFLRYLDVKLLPQFVSTGLYPGLRDFWKEMNQYGYDVTGLFPTNAQCQA